ncbi:unnamed protein product [Brassica napus]|nr:unnamed protein product [Brassica napus]
MDYLQYPQQRHPLQQREAEKRKMYLISAGLGYNLNIFPSHLPTCSASDQTFTDLLVNNYLLRGFFIRTRTFETHFPSLLLFPVNNARLARQNRRLLMRIRRTANSPQQDIQRTQETILPDQVDNIDVDSPEQVTARASRALRIKKQKSKRVATRDKNVASTSGSRPVRYRRPVVNKWDLVKCPVCQAIVWIAEAVVQETEKSPRMFSICCQQGRVKLPPRRQPPSPLKELLDKSNFKSIIRIANGMLAFTSMGGQIDNSVTNSCGPYAFRLHGQTHHKIGSLLPPDGKFPQYLQLYIVDTDNEVANRKKAFSKGTSALEIDDNLVVDLIKMLDENNHLAKTFRHARDRVLSGGAVEFSVRLVNQKHHGR